jgi:hypothetical protein
MSYKNKYRKGITLIELMITVLAAIILLIGISGILAAGHKNFWTMSKRINSDVVRNGYEARLTFDRIVRKSVYGYCNLNAGKDELVVYYYSQNKLLDLASFPDSYAMFYKDGNLLRLQQSTLANWPPTSIPSHNNTDPIIALNVFSVEFTIKGASIRMNLVLDDTGDTTKSALETLKLTITTTALRNNKLPK